MQELFLPQLLRNAHIYVHAEEGRLLQEITAETARVLHLGEVSLLRNVRQVLDILQEWLQGIAQLCLHFRVPLLLNSTHQVRYVDVYCLYIPQLVGTSLRLVPYWESCLGVFSRVPQ